MCFTFFCCLSFRPSTIGSVCRYWLETFCAQNCLAWRYNCPKLRCSKESHCNGQLHIRISSVDVEILTLAPVSMQKETIIIIQSLYISSFLIVIQYRKNSIGTERSRWSLTENTFIIIYFFIVLRTTVI